MVVAEPDLALASMGPSGVAAMMVLPWRPLTPEGIKTAWVAPGILTEIRPELTPRMVSMAEKSVSR